MSDLSLVERLRFYGETYPYQAEAADRIEQLEEALRTIAKAGGFITRTTGELVCRADVTREIARAVITAQGIEARQGGDATQIAAPSSDESPVGEADAPKTCPGE